VLTGNLSPPQGNLPISPDVVTVSTDRPLPSLPFVPLPTAAVTPYMWLYPGALKSSVNTMDTPYVCSYSRASNPSVQRNIVAGGTVGFLTFGAVVRALWIVSISGLAEVIGVVLVWYTISLPLIKRRKDRL
jgi:hypothetical protein